MFIPRNDYSSAQQRLCWDDNETLHLFIITAIIALVVILLGTIGNILSFVTVRSTNFACSASTRIILSTMLIVDQAVLLCGLLPFWLSTTFDVEVKLSTVGCPVFTFLTYYPRQLSAFLICLLTVERLIAVCVPLRCK